jgi:hypothetical protein
MALIFLQIFLTGRLTVGVDRTSGRIHFAEGPPTPRPHRYHKEACDLRTDALGKVNALPRMKSYTDHRHNPDHAVLS